jgi:4-amino-4-deoxy-L-arabinose transferase-like glycosyltransferase
MRNQNPTDLRNRIRPLTALISLGAGAVLWLSLSHHLWNVWGLSLARAAALMAVMIPLALLIYLLLGRIQAELRRIPPLRWFLFSAAALLAAAVIVWRVYTPPQSWHRLEIEPLSGQTELIEIKIPVGALPPFADIELPPGWEYRDSMLFAGQPDAEPLAFSFWSPADRPVSLLFIKSPESGTVQIRLDGQTQALDLYDTARGQRQTELDTRYRSLPNALTAPIVAGIDLLAFTLLIVLAWLAQEITQPASAQITPSAARSGWVFHRRPLLILLALALALHTINALAVPLILDVDSPTYLNGAVHWLQYRNLDGVSPQRGVGSTLLFTPVLALWGRNPWGMKLLLHLLGIGCALLGYGIGWRLTHQRWFGFAAGLVTLLTPDLMFYANYVMSDLPNVFFTLLFCWALLGVLQTRKFGWQVGALLTGAYAVLFRSDNTVMLAAGAGFIALQLAWDAIQRQPGRRSLINPVGQFGLACLLTALPLLAWSYHNYRQHGFFGLSNYTGAVLYDGWIYFGESIRTPVTDTDSPAVQAILAAHERQPELSAPAGFRGDTWDDYAILLADGRTSDEAYAVMMQAALDSIQKDPAQTLELLAIKVREGLQPETTATKTYPLPGEQPQPGPIKPHFFDDESVQIPLLIRAQRLVYQVLGDGYRLVYPAWVWFCLSATLLCLFRKPFFAWAPLVAIAFLKVFFPLIIGFGMWRYVVSGIVLIEIFALAGLVTLVKFLGMVSGLRQSRSG